MSSTHKWCSPAIEGGFLSRCKWWTIWRWANRLGFLLRDCAWFWNSSLEFCWVSVLNWRLWGLGWSQFLLWWLWFWLCWCLFWFLFWFCYFLFNFFWWCWLGLLSWLLRLNWFLFCFYGRLSYFSFFYFWFFGWLFDWFGFGCWFFFFSNWYCFFLNCRRRRSLINGFYFLINWFLLWLILVFLFV